MPLRLLQILILRFTGPLFAYLKKTRAVIFRILPYLAKNLPLLMIRFRTVIQKFDKQGEKTGWTYILLSAKQAEMLNPGVKTSYRVKGKLDDYAIEKLAILPMGDGSFILPLNADIRKGIRKMKGAELEVELEYDKNAIEMDAEFMECLFDEPAALQFFQSLPMGHRNYFSKWIETAKTGATKAKRIALAVNALAKKMGYAEMIRADKADRQKLGR